MSSLNHHPYTMWPFWVWSAALVLSLQVPIAAQPSPQTPWQSHATGHLRTDAPWNYAMGYDFTPLVDGQVTALGGFFNGTKTVKLFNKSTGQLLASTLVSATNTWSYAALAAPVSVKTGIQYTVVVYLAGSGGSYRDALARPFYLHRFPQVFGDIRIDDATYADTSRDPNARPTTLRFHGMFGQAEIMFVPNELPRLSLTVTPTTWSAGALDVSATTQMAPDQRITVTNDGNTTETFALQAVSPAGWSASAQAGPEQYVLQGLFGALTAAPPLARQFFIDDIVMSVSQRASASTFTFNGSPQHGANVSAAASRALWLRLTAPTRTQFVGERAIQVVITAEAP